MNIQPIFASSVFTISPRCEVYQVLCYDYVDTKGLYVAILHNEEAFEKEIDTLRENMAKFLAAEQVFINGQKVVQKIIHLDIGLRGTADIPYFQWVIFFEGPSKPGDNSLVSDVEEEIAEYDIEVMYLFPPGTQIKQVQTPMEYEVIDSLLLVWARKGDTVGGHEEVMFRFASIDK